MPPRVLILTASVGEGHDAPTRTLSEQLRGERPDVEIVVADGLRHMGRAVRALSERAPRVVFFRGEWLWDAGYAVFARFAPTRRLGQWLLARAGSRGLLELVESTRPDVAVSLYPQTSEVLGRLRARERVRLPVVAAITDLSALHYWATPGADVHLITHPESEAEVRRIAGAGADVRCVHGFTTARFLEPRDRDGARRALGLPVDGRVALVSGGGWGVGSVDEAVDTCLRTGRFARVVCLCGRNERLRATLASRYHDDIRVRVEGFTDAMPDWLGAADVLVHSTGGLTMLEAQMSGCPAISYGWGRGHVRDHNAAYRRFGLAQVALSPDELRACLDHALAGGTVVPFDFASLPSAASVVLSLAERGS
jgi:UDP-N-acetylglucosamine:LPS N-acetylglucosamine transferase